MALLLLPPLSADAQELQTALQRAHQETEDAIQTHNKKYNDMLAERMRVEDGLTDQLGGLQKQLAAMTAARDGLEAQYGDARTRWDQDRAQMLEERKVCCAPARANAFTCLLAHACGQPSPGHVPWRQFGPCQAASMQPDPCCREASHVMPGGLDGPCVPTGRVQALDASWKTKVESLVEELQREKAAGKDAAAKAAAADADAQASIRSLNASLAKAEQGLAAKAKEADG